MHRQKVVKGTYHNQLGARSAGRTRLYGLCGNQIDWSRCPDVHALGLPRLVCNSDRNT